MRAVENDAMIIDETEAWHGSRIWKIVGTLSVFARGGQWPSMCHRYRHDTPRGLGGGKYEHDIVGVRRKARSWRDIRG